MRVRTENKIIALVWVATSVVVGSIMCNLVTMAFEKDPKPEINQPELELLEHEYEPIRSIRSL